MRRGRWPGRLDARLPARPPGHRGDGAGEARRLFCATSAATPSTPPPSRRSTNWASVRPSPPCPEAARSGSSRPPSTMAPIASPTFAACPALTRTCCFCRNGISSTCWRARRPSIRPSGYSDRPGSRRCSGIATAGCAACSRPARTATLRSAPGSRSAATARPRPVRAALGLQPDRVRCPMDVLWFRLTRRPDDPPGLGAFVGAGGLMICIDRGDYFQCGVRHRQGRLRCLAGEGAAEPAGQHRPPSAPTAGSGGRTVHMGRCRSAHGAGEPAPGMACAGRAGHRRRSPRDVPDRRRRDQPGGAGRRRDCANPRARPR